MYVSFIEFRLLKHSDELDIKSPTLLGSTARALPPPAGYGPVLTTDTYNVCIDYDNH